jgi:putative ABC transport system substrate-binding protein
MLTVEIGAKRLELLKETLPKIRRVVVLGNPRNPAYKTQLAEVQAAAKLLELQLQIVQSRAPEEFATAFSAMTKEHTPALLVLTDAMFNAQRQRIVELAASSRIPAIYDFKEFAEAGGLMRYGAISMRSTVAPQYTSTRSSKAASPASYRSNNPLSSSSS